MSTLVVPNWSEHPLFAKRLRASCCDVCGMRPGLQVSNDPIGTEWRVTANCHGATETIAIPYRDAYETSHLVFFVPKPRGWSSCRRATLAELLAKPDRKVVIE